MHILCISDIHLKIGHQKEVNRMIIAIKESLKTYQSLDALFVTGDFTEYGSDLEYALFLSILDEYLPKSVKRYVSIGNHENLRKETHPHQKFEDALGQSVNHVFDLHGYKIITFGTTPSETFTIEELSWLENELHQAVNRESNKPIFLLEHYPPFQTVDYSVMGGKANLYPILSKFPQIFHICGHTHPHLKDPRIISTNPFVCFNNGSMSWQIYKDHYLEEAKDAIPVGQYAVLVIHDNNHIVIDRYEIDEEKQISCLIENSITIHF